MSYKNTVKQLLNIQWQRLKTQKELTQLMYISLITAIEFSQSLRIALRLNSENENLLKMSQGELMTDNLSFADYNKVGDHWEFLFHFLFKHGYVKESRINLGNLWVYHLTRDIGHEVIKEVINYATATEFMPSQDRAMSIFSREEELSKIFQNMLEKVPVFKEENLPEHLLAFKYYLERHIALDSSEGGHHDLVKGLEITDNVDIFYKHRLRLYDGAFPQLHV